jgi:hypothetical protein
MEIYYINPATYKGKLLFSPSHMIKANELSNIQGNWQEGVVTRCRRPFLKTYSKQPRISIND